MRTTLQLDDDLIATARQMARDQGVTLGEVISKLARKSLASTAPPKVRNGFQLLTPKPGGFRADQDFVNRLRDED